MQKEQQAKREKMILIRITDSEAQQIKNDTDIAKLTTSELCRRRLFNRKITARIDQTTINELRRIGGMLKQIFKMGNGTNETAEMLKEAKKAIQRIASPTTAEV